MISFILRILSYAASVFGAAKQFGLNLGPVASEVVNILDETAIGKADYEAGQAVVLGTFTENGAPGTIVVVKNGGPAAKALGL